MKVTTRHIRTALECGALSMRDLARRCGARTTEPLHPLVSQMRHRTGEVVKIGSCYALARHRCRLAEVYR